MLRVWFVRPLASLFALLFAVLVTVSGPRLAEAQPGGWPPPRGSVSGDDLTVYVITFGPGDHPFYKFGHDAIWIHNAAASPRDSLRRDPVYNFGTFAFGDPALIPKFVQGRFLYWLSVQSIGMTKRIYQAENRSVNAQKLNLTAAQKLALYEALEENALEQNKFYKYDYYQDNCATRVRDAIDKATGGKLKEASQAPASMTWRHHTLRLTADDATLSLALTVVMGSFIDRPLTQWQEMFLPAYVEEGLRRVKVPGPDGTEIPLVQSEEPLVVAKGRAPLRTEAPSWGIWALLTGLIFGGAFFAAGRAAKNSLPARIGLGLLLFIAGFASILGVLFVFVWIGTDHEVGYHNENILQLLPLCVALMGFCFGVARLKPKAISRARLLVTAAAAASALGLIWKVLPWMRQDNYWIIAFALPMWSGATLGLRALEQAVGGAAPRKERAAAGGKKVAAETESKDDAAEPKATADKG